MNFSVYDVSVPGFINHLKSLSRILEKAKLYADDKKIDMSVLFSTRLFPDQFPLSKQIQIACDNAKFFVSRLTSIDAPQHPDTEETLEEFQHRIYSTIHFLESVTPEDFDGWEARIVMFNWNPDYYLTAPTYILQYAIPNILFHYVTAYSILRSCGLEIGKADFLGYIDWRQAK